MYSPGGSALYSSFAAAKNSYVDLISIIGEDFPFTVFKNLEKGLITTNNLKRIKGKSTSFTVTYNDQWEPYYECIEQGVGNRLQPSILVNDIDSKWIYISPMIPDIQLQWVEFAKSKKLKIALGTNNIHTSIPEKREILLRMLSSIDVFMCNRNEAAQLFGGLNEEDSINMMGAKVKIGLITLDKDGCIASFKNTIIRYPSKETNIVDPSGAGDVFAGTFLSIWISSKDFTLAIDEAMKESAKVISNMGISSFMNKPLNLFY
ncbi:sugar/nucleoside kinase (ribokinase family) [Marinifilum flexuosum]|uniref:Sugar/nucleoside kinase (Ribokinase family) n=2 Tax=Marinifilum flexuosum TaxID=1117708 RepID=A0A419X417_9BACT|nr:sugar/nucleoside kinase (ribokinase family) [Marinifilum flexuosum]